MIKKIFLYLLSRVNTIIPKQRKVLIYAGRRLSDNNEAMFNYLISYTRHKIVCIADTHMEYRYGSNVTIKKNTTLNVLYELLTSKVVVVSFLHKYKVRPSKNQCIIQLWHGSPLKRIDKMPEKRFGQYYSIIAFSSEIFKDAMVSAFGGYEKKMTLIGNPRNDYLFNHKEVVEFDFKSINIIWMPTYRQGLGEISTTKDIPILDEEKVCELNEYLAKEKIMLFIKPHPHQSTSFRRIIGKKTNIFLLLDEDLIRKNIPLYLFLGKMDALITDYSSVYFDFLLLNRPIAFAIDDIEEYRANRGLTFSNPYEVMPGKKMYTYEDLICFFKEMAEGKDNYEKERKVVRKLVNYYQDAESCSRCAKIIDRWLS